MNPLVLPRRFPPLTRRTRLPPSRRDAGFPAPRRLAFGLWLPLTPILVLLSPLIVMIATLALAARPRRRRPPLRFVLGLVGVLMSLSGACVEVDTPQAHVRLRIL